MTYRQLPSEFYAESLPMKLRDLRVLIVNSELASQLDIGLDELSEENMFAVFSGDVTTFDLPPVSMAYSGHQFGYLSPQLGDGRAVLLSERVSKNGQRFDIHLKGSGQTPYSRRGDGKSTLRAVLKEYIFSESLAALGIPTTRSLAVVLTGKSVRRDKIHQGAVLFRTASSHIRVGTFVYARLLNNTNSLKTLTDYTIAREYPDINLDNPTCYQTFLESVIFRQAKLIAKWMASGFIHGVMNTDNMTISGETIDFGPCAFMDGFNENQVYSAIDEGGRYAWNNQPEMALWNLTRFAETLIELLDRDATSAIEKAKASLARFMPTYLTHFHQLMASKLGVKVDDEHVALIKQIFALLQTEKVDYTTFFSELTRVANGEKPNKLIALFNLEAFDIWLESWFVLREELSDKTILKEQMRRVNPIFIPRTYLVEQALESARYEKMDDFNNLLKVIQTPYEENQTLADLALPAEKWQSQITTFCET